MADQHGDGDPSPETERSNLTRKTVAGVRWNYVQTAVNTALRLVLTAILSRLLGPKVFGLIAVAELVLRFVNYFARMGVAQALVQKAEVDERDLRSGFTAAVLLGASFWAIVWVAAPFAAALLDTEEAIPVLRWMGAGLFLASLGRVSGSLLQRRLRFRTIAIRNIASYVIGYGVIGIALALNGAGVWALVAANLSQTALQTLLAYLAAPHSLLPAWDRRSNRHLFSYGSRFSMISFLEFLGHDLDTLLVARFAGASRLGYYNRANQIVRLPVRQLTTNLANVLFPVFSSIQNQRERLYRAYVSSLGLAAAVLLPLIAGMAVASRELVLVILGSQWVPSIELVPFLALATAAQFLAHFGGTVCDATGQLNAKLALTIAKVVLLAGLLVLAAGGPLIWYGAALAASEVFGHAGYIWLLSRSFDGSLWGLVARHGRPLVAAGLVAGAIALARWPLLAIDAPLAVILLVDVVVGAMILAACFRFGPLRPVRDDIAGRLVRAGYLDGDGIVGRLLRRTIGAVEAPVA